MKGHQHRSRPSRGQPSAAPESGTRDPASQDAEAGLLAELLAALRAVDGSWPHRSRDAVGVSEAAPGVSKPDTGRGR